MPTIITVVVAELFGLISKMAVHARAVQMRNQDAIPFP